MLALDEQPQKSNSMSARQIKEMDNEETNQNEDEQQIRLEVVEEKTDHGSDKKTSNYQHTDLRKQESAFSEYSQRKRDQKLNQKKLEYMLQMNPENEKLIKQCLNKN